jgi:hypothetical protein
MTVYHDRSECGAGRKVLEFTTKNSEWEGVVAARSRRVRFGLDPTPLRGLVTAYTPDEPRLRARLPSWCTDAGLVQEPSDRRIGEAAQRRQRNHHYRFGGVAWAPTFSQRRKGLRSIPGARHRQLVSKVRACSDRERTCQRGKYLL